MSKERNGPKYVGGLYLVRKFTRGERILKQIKDFEPTTSVSDLLFCLYNYHYQWPDEPFYKLNITCPISLKRMKQSILRSHLCVTGNQGYNPNGNRIYSITPSHFECFEGTNFFLDKNLKKGFF